MLRALKNLLDTVLAPPAERSEAEQSHFLRLATAVLLVEVMRADPALGVAERRAVVAGLRAKFALSDQEIGELVALAEETARSANDFHQFTSALNEGFGQEQKIRIVENMWRVAFADGHLDAHENHVISKVAGLLHVTHGEYIAAKMRAREG
ncbi:TerB family tellurite resistance protein [Ramlibacter sp. RBP-2]|uniref:TerB family tellurite resistance protein n=1 Tax=Ramlibacter lithotrophicus TaxID=2606681 RepID=A0A7X6I4L9_9BURK|nr:TerB family tellurite resistance protein [Ramlibacter lithotrophicus]NKE64401.1 TerB family tellurite resistance protein [Ramlibacter lithotrophicus]